MNSRSSDSLACNCDELHPVAPKTNGRKFGLVAGSLSGFALLLVPKCPVCIVAYVTAFTGLGISVSLASHFRAGLLITLASIMSAGVMWALLSNRYKSAATVSTKNRN